MGDFEIGHFDSGFCQNCGRPNTQTRPISFNGYAGTEFYCSHCPPEKWSSIVVKTVTPLSIQTWDEIFKGIKELDGEVTGEG